MILALQRNTFSRFYYFLLLYGAVWSTFTNARKTWILVRSVERWTWFINWLQAENWASFSCEGKRICLLSQQARFKPCDQVKITPDKCWDEQVAATQLKGETSWCDNSGFVVLVKWNIPVFKANHCHALKSSPKKRKKKKRINKNDEIKNWMYCRCFVLKWKLKNKICDWMPTNVQSDKIKVIVFLCFYFMFG